MTSRLLNVRLGPEEDQLAQQLRARGVSISDLVRRALHEEARRCLIEPVDTDRLLDEIYACYPPPDASVHERPKTTDRRAVQRHIKAKLRAQR